jgi:hypothetical protein
MPYSWEDLLAYRMDVNTEVKLLGCGRLCRGAVRDAVQTMDACMATGPSGRAGLPRMLAAGLRSAAHLKG